MGRSPQKRNSGEAATSFGDKKDACTLLTGAEIEAVQGEPVSETKTSVQPNGEMLITECLYQTITSAKSVSVALAALSSAKPSTLTPRKFWQKQFHAPEMEENEIRDRRHRDGGRPGQRVKRKQASRAGLRGLVRKPTGWNTDHGSTLCS